MNLLRIKDSRNIKISFLILSLLIVSSKSFACDICGCFMGITPYDNQSNVSLLYRYRSFSGYQGQSHPVFPSGARFLRLSSQTDADLGRHNNDPSDYEIYRALELRGRYFISKRLELNAILPYNSNSEQYNNNLSTVAGIGDVNVFAGYHLIRKLDRKLNQRLITGAGLKLPTGKDDAKNYQGLAYGTLMQSGTGSTDAFVYINYLLGYRKSGLSLSSTYKMNGQNERAESIANSTTAFLNLFYNVSLSKSVKLVPSVQFAYEYSGGEKYKGKRTGEHVMNNLMSGLGADIFFKNITLNTAYQTKAWAAQDDHPLPAGRVVLGLTFNFNQLYYLVNVSN